MTDVSKTVDGVKLLDKVSFIVNKNDKIAFVGENELAQTTMFKILMGELEPDEGSVKWGQTCIRSFPSFWELGSTAGGTEPSPAASSRNR